MLKMYVFWAKYFGSEGVNKLNISNLRVPGRNSLIFSRIFRKLIADGIATYRCHFMCS